MYALFSLSLLTPHEVSNFQDNSSISGAVAERAKLKSYILLGCLVILIQALPAHWVWDSEGFFYKMGVVDFAGCSAVHMVGGIIGLIATVYLKPRRNRFNEDSVHQMSSPTNALLGTFLLWWGWFGINAGSVWGITSGRWRLGARAAVATIMSSIGGGATSIVISFAKTKKLQVNFLINGILSSIVSITAMCAVSRPWHALIVGGVSAAFSISVLPLLERLKVDDPVGIVPIHLTSSIWGMTAVGIFCEKDRHLLISKSPLGLRVTDYEEQIGADVIEHGLAGTNVARYVLEKPLSTRTFQTVTKAITKWKMLAKTKSRSKRMEQARQKRLTEEQAFTATDTTPTVNGANGVPLTGNGAVHRRRKESVADVAATISPRANGIRPPRRDFDIEAQNHTPPSKPSSPQSGNTRRASESTATERPVSSGKSTRRNSTQPTESLDGDRTSPMSRPSISNPSSEQRLSERPTKSCRKIRSIAVSSSLDATRRHQPGQ
ncbi:Ammonium transporter [Trichostrongylus colubriformis]|uniref:Ammonium transporter n=1 Tax=Trichostrongylus colubriformis TaxID=6319 RepID=A0AAN8FUF9_TRICO